jgi:hypothetical protein
MASKTFTNGHKTFTVNENSFLCAVYNKEEKQRRIHPNKRHARVRNPIIAEPTSRLKEYLPSARKGTARKDTSRKNTGRNSLNSARSQSSNKSYSSNLTSRSNRAFDYERPPAKLVDPRLASARTHASSARTSRSDASSYSEEKRVKKMIAKRRWLQKQLSEIDEELLLATESPKK